MPKDKGGYFITFEGGEGTGKSSQINILCESLKNLNKDVVFTREPGGTTGAEAIRHVLLTGSAEPLGADTEAILFAAARADHVNEVIRPALEQGAIVLCDRYIDSTRVYQGCTGNVDLSFLKELEVIVCEGAFPDLTLILDLDPEEGMKRAAKRRKSEDQADRFEKENLQIQKKRRKAFQDIAREEPERCELIDASGSEKEVAKRIWTVVLPRLEKAGII